MEEDTTAGLCYNWTLPEVLYCSTAPAKALGRRNGRMPQEVKNATGRWSSGGEWIGRSEHHRHREGAMGGGGEHGDCWLWLDTEVWRNLCTSPSRPPPRSLVLEWHLNGVILDVGKCGQTTHRDGAAALG